MGVRVGHVLNVVRVEVTANDYSHQHTIDGSRHGCDCHCCCRPLLWDDIHVYGSGFQCPTGDAALGGMGEKKHASGAY